MRALRAVFSGKKQKDPLQQIHGSLAIKVNTQNGISISSAVFAGLTIVTDRQTDRETTLLRL